MDSIELKLIDVLECLDGQELAQAEIRLEDVLVYITTEDMTDK